MDGCHGPKKEVGKMEVVSDGFKGVRALVSMKYSLNADILGSLSYIISP